MDNNNKLIEFCTKFEPFEPNEKMIRFIKNKEIIRLIPTMYGNSKVITDKNMPDNTIRIICDNGSYVDIVNIGK